jgi:ADP-ribose pyrophosphatase YjhB (NUDIX family)
VSRNLGRFGRARQRAYLTVSLATRGMTMGVRAAVFSGETEILLVRHSYVPGWYMPGGGVAPGETLRQALDKELREEGGIVLDGRPELFGVYLNRRLSRRDHVALYICREWHGIGFTPTREIVETGFFPVGRLPDGTTDGTRRRLDEILTGQTPAEEW